MGVIVTPDGRPASPAFGQGARSTVQGYDPKIHDKFFEAVTPSRQEAS